MDMKFICSNLWPNIVEYTLNNLFLKVKSKKVKDKTEEIVAEKIGLTRSTYTRAKKDIQEGTKEQGLGSIIIF